MSELKITKENFEEALKSELPILIDFWAPWCGPCRMMSPVVEELANEYQGKAIIGKVNVDDEPELASYFQVSSIPMFVVIKDRKIVKQKVGAMPKTILEELLK